VLPAPGVPNLFPQLLPPGRRGTQDGSEEDGAALFWTAIVLMKVTVFLSKKL